MKHTQGEWRFAVETDDYFGDVVVSEEGHLIADCNITNLSSEEGRANAKLIAAAPDLLIAAKKCVWLMTIIAKNLNLSKLDEVVKAMNQTQVAIKKATE